MVRNFGFKLCSVIYLMAEKQHATAALSSIKRDLIYPFEVSVYDVLSADLSKLVQSFPLGYLTQARPLSL